MIGIMIIITIIIIMITLSLYRVNLFSVETLLSMGALSS